MKGPNLYNRMLTFVLLAIIGIFIAVSAKGDPFLPPALTGNRVTFGITLPLIFAIVSEAICILLILRRWRRPRLFVLWVVVMHLFTYPLFLILLAIGTDWEPTMDTVMGQEVINSRSVEGVFHFFSFSPHPEAGLPLVMLLAEGVIVLIEGILIYLICRFLPSAKSELPAPSVPKSLFASFIGNIFSAVSFPVYLTLLGFILRSIGASQTASD